MDRTALEKKYASARLDLLIAIILTVLNIVMAITGSESMMLFSISFPYMAVIFAAMWEADILLILAAVSLIVYFLCWLFSKKHSGWILAAAIFFVLDTLCLGGMYLLAEEISSVMDMLFHVLILYYLFSGYAADRKLKKLSPEPEVEVTEEGQPLENSVPLRRIGEDEKCRVLLEAQHGIYHVCYRRIKRTNQLVINNYIYDEVEMLMETDHTLKAVLDGHVFEVGFRSTGSSSYFWVDGKEIAKKIRWF